MSRLLAFAAGLAVGLVTLAAAVVALAFILGPQIRNGTERRA